jgi:hypothetical protein
MALAAEAGSHPACSWCGNPAAKATAAKITAKAAADVGVIFWLCEDCVGADFPGGLPKPPGAADPPRPAPAAPRMWMSDEKVVSLLASDNIAADIRVLLLLPMLWLNWKRGLPANLCVQGCLTLRHAYGQLGIRAELRAVELVAREPSGRHIRLAGPGPSWQGPHFAGHCVLWLPEFGRLIDPTVQQFTDIALVRDGPPVMGRLPLTGGLPTGLGVEFIRDEVALAYTVLAAEYTAMIVNGHEVAAHSEAIRREGINLASLALISLRTSGRARPAPFPRLHSLLDAIGDALQSFADDGNWRFAIDGPGASPRLLDEIPLPAGAPPNPADEDPGTITPPP